ERPVPWQDASRFGQPEAVLKVAAALPPPVRCSSPVARAAVAAPRPALLAFSFPLRALPAVLWKGQLPTSCSAVAASKPGYWSGRRRTAAVTLPAVAALPPVVAALQSAVAEDAGPPLLGFATPVESTGPVSRAGLPHRAIWSAPRATGRGSCALP